LHSESIAICKHNMQEKLVYCYQDNIFIYIYIYIYTRLWRHRFSKSITLLAIYLQNIKAKNVTLGRWFCIRRIKVTEELQCSINIIILWNLMIFHIFLRHRWSYQILVVLFRPFGFTAPKHFKIIRLSHILSLSIPD
jgi:hypothetical protein